MKKEEQTPQVKERLYNLTLSFVRKYQPRYYKQYQGELEDLASDFFCQFLTEKSRVKGKEESLLDKYDSSVTSLEYLTKVSVQRMLIDRSRQDKSYNLSIDKFVDECGDLIMRTLDLVTVEEETVDSIEFTPDFIEDVKLRFQALSKEARESFKKKYFEIRNVLSPEYIRLFDNCCTPPKVEQLPQLSFSIEMDGSVVELNCYQITDKTVCLLFDGSIYNFNRFNGTGRGKDYRNWHLTLDSLEEVKEYETYKCRCSREEFIDKYTMVECF